MSTRRAPSPRQAPRALSPPLESGESAGSGTPDTAHALAVQLAGQASHLTLSSSGSDADSPAVDGRRTSAVTLVSSSEVSPPGAQHGLEIARGRTIQEWRREAMITPMGVTVTPVPPRLVSGFRPRIAEMQVAAAQTPTGKPSTVGNAVITSRSGVRSRHLLDLPNELLLQILSNLDVCDLLATSRTSHLLRRLALSPVLQRHRLRHARAVLPPLLTSPSRPSLTDLIRRSIFLTKTTVASRRLGRSLVAIRLQRHLARRPSPETLVARAVLPPECVPDPVARVAPALVAKRRAVERERVKDGLRRWLEGWKGEARMRGETVRRWEERAGVGRVWRLRRFWENQGRVGE
ncbi:hypothetical protein QBC47DRAFT_438150 [Echria macrotheca]|uniref:F-box domain-containing protein n=1 Tax=Echria macrotheca TaxID=438768 RepID=A0AAJ0BKI5_9PEZI|nr:hypothetical protein QBC47DRAFT_438150 [Echria macrotheca]